MAAPFFLLLDRRAAHRVYVVGMWLLVVSTYHRAGSKSIKNQKQKKEKEAKKREKRKSHPLSRSWHVTRHSAAAPAPAASSLVVSDRLIYTTVCVCVCMYSIYTHTTERDQFPPSYILLPTQTHAHTQKKVCIISLALEGNEDMPIWLNIHFDVCRLSKGLEDEFFRFEERKNSNLAFHSY